MARRSRKQQRSTTRFSLRMSSGMLHRACGRAPSATPIVERQLVAPQFAEASGWKRQGESVAARIGRGRISSEGGGSNPSPVPRRLVKAPSRDTLSPRERAVSSHTSGASRTYAPPADLGHGLFASPTVQHHPGARSATPPHLRRGVRGWHPTAGSGRRGRRRSGGRRDRLER